MNRKQMIDEIMLAVGYRPRNLINTVYMGAMATCYLYKIVGCPYGINQKPLQPYLEKASDETLHRAHEYTAHYRKYIAQQKADDIAWAEKLLAKDR